ncbi:MAG: RNA polymerase sigma factor [Acidobacteriota bacterium]
MRLAREGQCERCGEAWEQIEFLEAWSRHAPELQRRCLSWTGGNAGDAEEAFSRAASAIFCKFSSKAREITDVRAWFLRLTYNTCMDLHRERRRRGEQSLDEVDDDGRICFQQAHPAGNPERRFLDAELAAYLQVRIRELPPKLREALWLRIQQHSYEEIARRLSINEAAARKRVQLARQILHRQYAEYSFGSRKIRGFRLQGDADKNISNRKRR